MPDPAPIVSNDIKRGGARGREGEESAGSWHTYVHAWGANAHCLLLICAIYISPREEEGVSLRETTEEMEGGNAVVFARPGWVSLHGASVGTAP